MKKHLKLFVIYFPVILVGAQVLVNLMSFLFPGAYAATGFYLNTFFGTNMLFALFLLVFTFMFKFCEVSRWAAVAEVLFGLNYLIVQQDNLYNIMFQVIVGTLAIIATFWHYVKRFPLCNVSYVVGFLGRVVKSGSCEKGAEQWRRDIKSIMLKQQYHRKQHQ